MDNYKKDDDKFVNSIVARGADKDFVATKLNIKVSEFAEWLTSDRVKDVVKANNGWLRIEVLKSKKDNEKHYATLNDWTPNQVSSAAHSPDRGTFEKNPKDDMPF